MMGVVAQHILKQYIQPGCLLYIDDRRSIGDSMIYTVSRAISVADRKIEAKSELRYLLGPISPMCYILTASYPNSDFSIVVGLNPLPLIINHVHRK